MLHVYGRAPNVVMFLFSPPPCMPLNKQVPARCARHPPADAAGSPLLRLTQQGPRRSGCVRRTRRCRGVGACPAAVTHSLIWPTITVHWHHLPPFRASPLPQHSTRGRILKVHIRPWRPHQRVHGRRGARGARRTPRRRPPGRPCLNGSPPHFACTGALAQRMCGCTKNQAHPLQPPGPIQALLHSSLV
jgi:hypothetical protein